MDRKTRHRAATGRWILWWGLVVLTAWPALLQAQSLDQFVGTGTCLDCHENMAATLQQTVHGRLGSYQYPGAAEGCETCHGPGARHAETNDPADILVPSADLGNAGVENCLVCHKTGHTMDWDFSAHAAADVACLSCHKMHDNSRQALLSGCEQEICFSCHQDTKAKFMLPSHHPLREGFMTCTTCHDVHGDRFQGVADGETTRDACLVCHMEHAGPYIFEHSPVMEDCGICHDVHGAVANNLLHQNEPFICLQCHQPHFHTILAGDETTWDPTDAVVNADPNYDGLSLTSHADSMKRAMLTKCTQCHQAIHGTDLPSQGITGQGRALNR